MKPGTASHFPYKHSDITERIIADFYKVYNGLGFGFLEKVYENALCIELAKSGLNPEQQCSIPVFYAGHIVGQYFADIVVAGEVLVEIKAVSKLAQEHEAQLINYLKATPFEVGLLLNFGPKAEIKRRSFENTRKEWWRVQNLSDDKKSAKS
jgi:GxxExxY protein